MYLESVKFEVDEMGFMRAYNRNEMNESQLILNQSGLMEALFPVSESTRKASWLLHGFCGRHGPTSGLFESPLFIPFADAHLNSWRWNARHSHPKM